MHAVLFYTQLLAIAIEQIHAFLYLEYKQKRQKRLYSRTPPYGHLDNTVTSLLRPVFFGPAKRPYISL